MGCCVSHPRGGEVPIPADFPSGVEAIMQTYANWDQTILAANVLECYPKNEEDIVAVANWAVAKKWTVRATGIKHTWLPITITPQGEHTDLSGVVLVNLMKNMKKVAVRPATDNAPPTAVVQLGVGQLEFLTALQQHTEGGTGDIGYGLIHTPAPDSISVGGILAIDGHGTAVPSAAEATYNDPATSNYGTYSNLILSVRALVWDGTKGEYVFQDFPREQAAPFLTHCGRSLLSEATLQIQKNYYMRCQSFLNVHWEQMFPKTEDWQHPPPESMAYHVLTTGRAEAIWFPFTKFPWLKVWTVTGPEQPHGSRKVESALNYPFSDDLGNEITELFRSILGQKQQVPETQIQAALDANKQRLQNYDDVRRHVKETFDEFLNKVTTQVGAAGAELIGSPKLTPLLNKLVWLRVLAGLATENAWDLWGPSKNTLIYVRDTTLRVTANGYVIMTTPSNVQECMYEFTQMYMRLLKSFEAQGKYPISCPLEIRVTGVDDPACIGNGTFATPPMSALCYDDEAKERGWTRAVWLDVLALPGAPDSDDFYVEMEKAFLACPAFNGERGRIRPEWSKGWGYTKEGAWTNESFLDSTRRSLPQWNQMMSALDQHDEKKLYTNPWMSSFFVPV